MLPLSKYTVTVHCFSLESVTSISNSVEDGHRFEPQANILHTKIGTRKKPYLPLAITFFVKLIIVVIGSLDRSTSTFVQCTYFVVYRNVRINKNYFLCFIIIVLCTWKGLKNSGKNTEKLEKSKINTFFIIFFYILKKLSLIPFKI